MTTMTKPVSPDDQMTQEVLSGLMAADKYISPKWLYDQHGSELFEDITRTEDYYPTRTEAAIFKGMMNELAGMIGTGGAVAEYGSGASVKTRMLLDAVKPDLYVPLDIAAEFMEDAVADLAPDYPGLAIEPVVADFTRSVALPESFYRHETRLGFFPGSTIGNFEAGKSEEFLARARESLRDGASFLLSADLVKEPEILVRAYDDRDGVTAAFNLNLLTRFNRDLGADFDLDGFRHEAVWNEERSRIEMHLVSLRDQTVTLAGERLTFAEGERIHTENSHKYTVDGIALMAERAGWRLEKSWTDPKDWFGVFLLRA